MARTALPSGQAASRCPLLAVQRVQFCTASPIHMLVPCNTAMYSRCQDDAHSYCPLYLQRARFLAPHSTLGAAANGAELPPAPGRLAYTRNHLWLDVAADGGCHVGIDAFAARVLGRVDHVSFLSGNGLGWPAAVLTLARADLRMVFPRRIRVIGSNVHLRSDPQLVVVDPYGAGWLFVGTTPLGVGAAAPGEPELIPGHAARPWMQSEMTRLDRFVRDALPGADPSVNAGGRCAADGGRVVPGVAQHLERDQVMRLYHAFFALHGEGGE